MHCDCLSVWICFKIHCNDIVHVLFGIPRYVYIIIFNVYLCICIFMHMLIYLYVNMYVYIYVYVYIFIYIFIYVCVCVYVFVHVLNLQGHHPDLLREMSANCGKMTELSYWVEKCYDKNSR